MGERVKVVAKIADNEHRGRVRLNEAAYLAASAQAIVPCLSRKPQRDLEGFLFPATYDFLAATTSRQLVGAQLATFCRRFSGVNLAYARSKNLTPYDVLKIASMIEREAAVPAERPLIAAVIYNRLHDRMQLGIDATLRYGLHIPPTQSITESELASLEPYNTRKRLRLAADADRGTRGWPSIELPRTPPTSTTPSTSCASPITSTTTSRPA